MASSSRLYQRYRRAGDRLLRATCCLASLAGSSMQMEVPQGARPGSAARLLDPHESILTRPLCLVLAAHTQGKGSAQFFPILAIDDIMKGRCEGDYHSKNCHTVSPNCAEQFEKTLSNMNGEYSAPTALDSTRFFVCLS